MKVRAMFATMAVLALLATGSAPAAEEKAAAHHEEKTSAVQGEVLDLACYVGHGAMGEGHIACATKCLKGGQPMGLLGTDGTVYMLFADHGDASAFEKTKEFAGKKVEVTGEVATKGALKGITVHGVKAL
jgi:hypothetical protein